MQMLTGSLPGSELSKTEMKKRRTGEEKIELASGVKEEVEGKNEGKYVDILKGGGEFRCIKIHHLDFFSHTPHGHTGDSLWGNCHEDDLLGKLP